MSEIAVIIPNYKGKNVIRDCLNSLREQDFKGFDIIVADNKSDDGSLDIIEKEYPEVKLIKLSDNFGFSRAVNEGLKVSSHPYVILLNNDTRVDKSFVRSLYEAIKSDNRIFSVSAKMLQMDRPDRIDGAGDYYSALGWAYARGKGKKSNRYNKVCDVFSACAGAAIYRRKILDEIGWFDEFHFAYLEDIDIGYRGRIMGYRNTYEPKAIVWHKGSGVTGSRYNGFKVRISARNNMYIVMKNMPTIQIVLNLPLLIIGFSVKALFFVFKGYGREYLSGIKRGYLLCKEGRKFPYSGSNFKNYVKIQLELWLNSIRRFTEVIF
ncbi:glycosyltransferase family 2 protein [Lachnospiraceae bacterium C1.1]|nr:glycosyltransferase family 2 protein [Lachnospiraceae bacterium C1.1]